MVGSFHTLLSEYTEVLSGSRRLGQAMRDYQRWAYGRCGTVLAPSQATRAAARRRRLPRRSAAGLGARRRHAHLHARGALGGAASRLGRPAAACRSSPTSGGCRARRASTCCRGSASRCARTDSRTGCSFIGDGPMRAELQAACPGAIFTGRVAHEHVPALLASADVFLFPSRTDTFGNVVLEAQACGLPVIVTDEGGPREAVRHGETGLSAARRDRSRWRWRFVAAARAGASRADGGGGAALRAGAELAAGARAALRRVARGASRPSRRRGRPARITPAPMPSPAAGALGLGCKVQVP